MTEREIQKQILDFLAKCPVVDFATKYNQVQASKRHTRSKHQIKGIADICGNMVNGVALYIEVKAPKGKVSTEQQKFIIDRQNSNCVAFIATSIEDVIEGFSDFGFHLDEEELQRY